MLAQVASAAVAKCKWVLGRILDNYIKGGFVIMSMATGIIVME
jgi:hypothetical protein